MSVVAADPFLDVLWIAGRRYLIANDGIAERNLERVQAERAQMDDYVRSVSDTGGAAAEIEWAKTLLDAGEITVGYDAIKAKALA